MPPPRISPGESPILSDSGPPDSPRDTLRLVIDTNLFVGLLFRPNAAGPRGVWDLWTDGEVRVCVSDAVLREVRATLGRLPVAPTRREAILRRLEDPARAELIPDPPDSGFRCADPSDDKFLHLALAAGADALITSDRALLEVEDFPVPIAKSGQWLRSAGRRSR